MCLSGEGDDCSFPEQSDTLVLLHFIMEAVSYGFAIANSFVSLSTTTTLFLPFTLKEHVRLTALMKTNFTTDFNDYLTSDYTYIRL